MSRTASKERMGFYAISEAHHAAILSLVAPATPATRILDPFAGEGAFLQAAAQAWNVTPYANELDGERAAKCIERFGPKQAVRCDVERLSASQSSFSAIWANPPYDHYKLSGDNKRVEFRYLRHSWKWAQAGSVVMWCIYQQHITEKTCYSPLNQQVQPAPADTPRYRTRWRDRDTFSRLCSGERNDDLR